MSVEVLNESGTEVDVDGLARLSRFVMDRLRVHPQAELCLQVVDEDTIASLNERWMDGTGPTDVLAFPMDELRPGLVNEDPQEGMLGDIALCAAVARRQAEQVRAEQAASGAPATHSAEDEIELLTVHGILHLLGYDHAEAEEHKEMFALQGRLLSEWQTARHSEDLPVEDLPGEVRAREGLADAERASSGGDFPG
jgi:probable rRNA maturation factor